MRFSRSPLKMSFSARETTDEVPSHARGTGRGVWPASSTGSEPCGLGRRSRGKPSYVLALAKRHRTNRSTIDPRRSHAGEESTVETAIAAADRLPTDCRVQLGCFVGGFQSEAPARKCIRQVLGNGGGCSHCKP